MSKRKLKRLYEKQQGRCLYCEYLAIDPDDLEMIDSQTFTIKNAVNRKKYLPIQNPKNFNSRAHINRTRATIEHLFRRADGGRDRVDNLAMACYYCNTCRDDRTVEEHKNYIAHLIEMKLHPNSKF